jgi:hypothetical protein
VVVLSAEISVASGLTQGMACNEQSWAYNHAILNCLLDRSVGPTAITNTRKASVEHLGADIRLSKQGHRFRVAKRSCQIVEAGHCNQVDMAVDQTWGDELSRAVD